MRNTLTIARKELSIYFTTPVAYALLGGMTFIAGMMFIAALRNFQQLSLRFITMQQPKMLEHLNLTERVIFPLLGNCGTIFLFICPFLAMRLVAEEKKNRTFELLMTSPVSPTQIMLGKYLAALALMLVAVALIGVFPFLVSVFGTSGTFTSPAAAGAHGVLDWGTVLSGLLGLFLVGAAMMAVGMFISSLTESVMVAAIVSLVVLLVLWILGWQAGSMEGAARSVVDFVTMPTHLESFVRGAPALKDLVYFLSFMIFFPFMTERAIEAQRWG
jgi:ABC-2 type transport system permease protein